MKTSSAALRPTVQTTYLGLLVVDQLFNSGSLGVSHAHQVSIFALSKFVNGIEDRLRSGVVLQFRKRLQMLQESLLASVSLQVWKISFVPQPSQTIRT